MFHRLRVNGVNGTYPGQNPPHITFGANGGGCMANGCMCVNDTLVNSDSFPMYLKAAGYTVGMFGEHPCNHIVKVFVPLLLLTPPKTLQIKFPPHSTKSRC